MGFYEMLKASDVNVALVDKSAIDLPFMRKGSPQSVSSVSSNTGGNTGGGNTGGNTASPSIILASAWVDELNKLDTDERKIANFVLTQGFSFFTSLGHGALEISYPESMANEFMYSDEVQDDFFGMFGFVENEKYPFDKYMPVIGSIGEDANAESLAFIMNNLAYATANGVDDIEPAKAFFLYSQTYH